MIALSVKNLCKTYPSFTLKNITFEIEEGRVVGLVGANGAGKSTTIKGILGLIDATGEASVYGIPVREREAKMLIGYAGGGFRFYPQKRLKTLKNAVAPFYPLWDHARFQGYCERFRLLPEKRISELSEGMKVKLSVALALSHGAKLIILDEPTSGLDPLSREEFCDLMLSIVREEGVSVLFSTHIVSDLERIADNVLFLSDGKMLWQGALSKLKDSYLIVRSFESGKGGVIGEKPVKEGFEGLILREDASRFSCVREATLDEIFIHLAYAKGDEHDF